MNDANNLATLAQSPTRRQILVAATAGLTALGIAWLRALARTQEGVFRTAESIHQEPVFKATPKRVYEALTDAKQFERVSQLGAAMQSGMALGNKPTQISLEAGGTFTLFGGHIVGRNVELVPNERIVQAWRVVTWSPGVYSIAKFELTEQGSSTKLVLTMWVFPTAKGNTWLKGGRRTTGSHWRNI